MVVLQKNVTGIVAVNSPAYILAIFSVLKTGGVAVPLRGQDDNARAAAAGVSLQLSPKPGYGWIGSEYESRKSDAIAQISFTSGTEGAPKGVLLSHRALADVEERLKLTMGLTSEVREYSGVPVYHSFGYGRCRAVCAMGGDIYIPQHGFNPIEISKMLLSREINALSAVPSMLRLLLEPPNFFGKERERLRWLEIGSQVLTKEQKIALRRLFPCARIVQHYGLTEASRTTLLRIDDTPDEQLDSVGCCVGDVQVKINSAGIICIKGSHLASGLIIEGTTASLPGEDGWFETSDLGRIENEHLYFLGRADNVINCGGQKISAEYLEDELARRGLASSNIVVVRIPDNRYGEAILVAQEAKTNCDKETLLAVTREIVSGYGITGRNAVKLFCIESFPVTETGKIIRGDIASRYEKQKGGRSQKKVEIEDETLEELLSLYQDAFEDGTVDVSHSVSNLWADSIVAVSVAMGLDKYFNELPTNWRTLSVADLAALAKNTSASPRKGKNEQEYATRANQHTPPLPIGSTNLNPPGISFCGLIREDFNTHDRDLFSQGFWAVFVNRFGNWRMGFKFKLFRAPLTLLYHVFRKGVQLSGGIKLDYTVKLGRRVKLEHFGGMILGAREIGDDVILRQNTTLGIKDMSDLAAKPTIEKGTNVGAGAVIVGNIRIGRYSVVGPNTVVNKSIPPYSVVAASESVILVEGLREANE